MIHMSGDRFLTHRVHFYDNNFDYAFFESSVRNGSRNKPKSKDIFSPRRAARMMWIKDVLADENAKMYVGYDSKTKSYDRSKLSSQAIALIT